jgi:hypothetical protein
VAILHIQSMWPIFAWANIRRGLVTRSQSSVCRADQVHKSLIDPTFGP